MALHEKPLPGGSGAAVVSGQLYVVSTPKNENGLVVRSPFTGTVAQMLTALGLSGGTIVSNCDTPSRASGAFVGPNQRGLDVFET
jgi:hypothetical protein